ncbi:hypothetical protein SAY86_000779 [Trapa natans]|uniref:RING-type E3 ubiquitin transferase n=1 Tax=Trapa natans TaxID=22666 RepID=A0AAN7RLS8_TRANT|nr:hypothetical protein SAY86_000779 [Trapa natans]
MARFSIGEGHGAGSSSRKQKRRRADPRTPIFSDDDLGEGGGARGGNGSNGIGLGRGGEHDHGDICSCEEESSQEEEEGSSSEEYSEDSGGEDLEPKGVEERHHHRDPIQGRSFTFSMTDTDSLDCAICYEPLSSPVFQCENGHVACSSCCTNMKNKCASCGWPIGYNRCRALEKILESVLLTCKFSNYGCKESISYNNRRDHEKSCLHIPCHCPLSYCSYIGSFKHVAHHFNSDHPCRRATFKFNVTKSILIRFDAEFHVLLEEKGESLFLLHNRVDQLGNKMTVSFIGPPSKGDHFYRIVAKHERSYLKLKTLAKSIQKVSQDLQVSPYLLIPKGFYSRSTLMELEILIRDHHTRI